MSASRALLDWDRLEALFEGALAHPPGERSAFLDRECPDPEVRSELESLLARAARAERLFDALAASLETLPPRVGPADPRAEPTGAAGDRPEAGSPEVSPGADRPSDQAAETSGPVETSPAPDPLLGSSVGHYRIEGRLGGGGMGVVYRARDTRLERDVALKFLPPHLGLDPEAKERFLVEARAAAALDHPSICTIHEIGEAEDGRLFIAMACYAGETLKERIARGPLPVAEAVAIATRIARGLAAAHARGVVHRDVKPGNVMLTADGDVKLLDFGLAKVADVTITRPGITPGTVAYMSPEQVGGEAADARTDLWSLGVVLYEMLTGRRPFRGEHDAAVVQAIRHGEPEPLGELRPETPEHLSEALCQLLAKDPIDRYPSVERLLADLERESGSTPLARNRPPPGRSRKRAAGLVAAVALLGAAGWALVNGVGGGSAEIRRVAVLPLANHTGDPGKDYFVAGMHEALITELGQSADLMVISRQSVLRYEESDRPLPAIARELGVDALVEGSVFLAGDSVRISAQLVRAAPEEHLWANTYRGALRDALALQGEVARAIARAVHARVTPGARARLASERAVDPAAHEAYLRGLYHLEQYRFGRLAYWLGTLHPGEPQKTLRTGIALLEEAVAVDPGWAAAHAKLALAYQLLAVDFPAEEPEFYPKSKAAALRALELDETEAQAHASLGFVRFFFEWDWAGAERAIRRALELDPNAHHSQYANYLHLAGRYDEAITHYRLAEERNPLSRSLKRQLVVAYFCAGRYDEAIAQAEHVSRLWPDREAGFISFFLGQVHGAKSMHAEAIAEFEKAIALSDSAPWAVASLAAAYGRAARHDEARPLLVWLEERSMGPYIPLVYAALGQTERAVAMVEVAFRERGLRPFWVLRCYPEWETLRAEPRVREIVRQIGLPD